LGDDLEFWDLLGDREGCEAETPRSLPPAQSIGQESEIRSLFSRFRDISKLIRDRGSFLHQAASGRISSLSNVYFSIFL
jgi:hypothetical protein